MTIKSLRKLMLMLAVALTWLPAQQVSGAEISNTARLIYTIGNSAPQMLPSNTVTLVAAEAPTPAVVRFFGYAPTANTAQVTPIDGAQCAGSNGVYTALPQASLSNGQLLPSSPQLPIRPVDVFHAGEPVFIQLADANRDTDPTKRDTIDLTVTTSAGDTELLRLQETGISTGTFVGVIQSIVSPPAAVKNNCVLSVEHSGTISVAYTDAFYPTDIATANVLIDPYGVLFDTTTGRGISGVSITLINVATGQPATVFGDDGVSAYPSTIVTGETVTDASGVTYTTIEGGYRFPFVPPGNYRLVLTPPPGFTIPSTLPLDVLRGLRDAIGNPYSLTTGSFGDVFTVSAGSSALNIDIPADPPAGAAQGRVLLIQKQASRIEAQAGDFVQYTVTFTNNAGRTINSANVVDVMPVGFRYRAKSVRIDGATAAEPVISSDGRSLRFFLGTVAPARKFVITYVTELSAGVKVGDAINTASANAAGNLSSNVAMATVRIKPAFFGSCGIVVGRVVDGACSADWTSLKGVPGVRIMLEDGTYTTTDRDGMYHFERICDGTHVVQMDLDTLSGELEATPCIQNTRFSGRSFSQFVDMQGGTLWRADFYARHKAPIEGPVGIRLKGTLTPSAMAAMPQRSTLNLNFDTRKAELTPVVKAQLDGLLASLGGKQIAHVAVVGHTDNVRIAPEHREEFADNFALSNARAATAANYLKAQLGLADNAAESRGLGETSPIASNATPEGRAQNRRVEVVLMPKAITAGPADLSYRLELDGGKVPVSNLKATVLLPDGIEPVAGTVTIDGKPAGDADYADGTASFKLGNVGAGWNRVVEFRAKAPAGDCPVQGYPARALAGFATTLDDKAKTPVVTATLPCPAVIAAREQRLSGIVHFDSRKTSIEGESAAMLSQMADSIAGPVTSLSVVAHADGQRIAPENRKEFDNNQILSDARASAVKDYLVGKLPIDNSLINLKGMSNFVPVADNGTAQGMAQNRRAEVTLTTAQAVGAASPSSAESERLQTTVQGKNLAVKKTLADTTDRLAARAAILDDVAAAGGRSDWLTGQTAGSAILFPGPNHNPRAPAVRIVVKHAPANRIKLIANGNSVSSLAYEGTLVNADKTVAVSVFQGVPLLEGDNAIEALEVSESGNVMARNNQIIHFANTPIRAEILPEQSVAVADGVTKPVIAVRFTDGKGRPVRAGLTGPYTLDAPYVTAETIRRQQERQLAGEDGFTPTYHVEGDNGVAYIELQPTTQSGYADLHFSFQQEHNTARKQDLRTWMASEARDWVVVGFAEGTVGYNTLNSKAEALAAGSKDELYTNGQVAFYAKGRVKGEWLATVAYDTKKLSDPRRNESLQQVINPNEYYQIYGDGAEQRYDAPSQRRLYLKLERGRFFALFGDYQTGLTQTQLSRYSRALNGIKSEYAGERFAYTVFGSQTQQNFVREEIQGNGTSGLYRLSQRGIVINSERISLVAHDRLRSELVRDTKALFRYIDYDIDYTNGTIFFKSPVNSRDFEFNPLFIQAEYETLASAKDHLNAGGRASVTLAGGALTIGASQIRDENDRNKTDLTGLDAKLKLGSDTEVRAEAAYSNAGTGVGGASAYLAEVEHHNKNLDVLAYARRQEAGFGVAQQSGFEAGTQKYGVTTRVPLSEKLSVSGEAYRHEGLSNGDSRDAANARLEYRLGKDGSVFAGAQFAKDDVSGKSAQSTLASVGANQRFLDGKVDVQARSDFAVGGQDKNVDFPSRYTLQLSYDVTAATKLVIAEELSQGDSYSSSTTRIGAISNPWKGGRLNTTLNQNVSEYGPRTFALYGLSQSFLIGQHWGLDMSLDRSETWNQSSKRPVVAQSNGFPLANGGVTGGGNGAGGLGSSFIQTNTEDFTAGTLGGTYRAERWSATMRGEIREGEREDRRGLTASFLRQANAGIAFAGNAQVFNASNAAGTSGTYGNANLSVAYRPLGSRWSILERLEYRHDAIESGTGIPGGGLFGANTLNVPGSARSRAVINHLAFNRVSRGWDYQDRQGNLFRLNQRSQMALYYGLKYANDRYNGVDYSGLTDFLGAEVRYDLTPKIDLGVQASVLHNYEANNFAYSVGPMVGLSPFENLWVSLGYNVVGFEDHDFEDASYTAQGPYLKTRFKFDQLTRLGSTASSDQAVTAKQLAAEQRGQ